MTVYPTLPWKRQIDHFKEGDRVMVYYSKQNVWKKGIVVKGYKYHNGYVSFYLEGEPIPKYDYIEPEDNTQDEKDFIQRIGKVAHSRGVGNNVPMILKEEEYTFFANHTQEWNNWKQLVIIPPYNNEFVALDKTPSATH